MQTSSARTRHQSVHLGGISAHGWGSSPGVVGEGETYGSQWQPPSELSFTSLYSQWREIVNSRVWGICPNVAICLRMRWIMARFLLIDCNGRVAQWVEWMVVLQEPNGGQNGHPLWSLRLEKELCLLYVTGLKRISESFGFKCAWNFICAPGWLVAQWPQGWNKIPNQNKYPKMHREIFTGLRVDSFSPFQIY